MSYKSKISEFEYSLGVLLNYLIHSFDDWSRVFKIYSSELGVGPKDPTLVKFHVI